MKKRVISIGHPEFPRGLAQVQRQLLLAKSIMREGWEVTVLCRWGTHSQKDSLPCRGVFEGVRYLYCSGVTSRPDGFFKRALLKLRGLIHEIYQILVFARTKQLKGMLVSKAGFQNVLLYFVVGKLFRITTVIDVVEHWSANADYKGLDRLNKRLYDQYYHLFADKIICISDHLIHRLAGVRRKSISKIPTITDFDKFRPDDNRSRIVQDKYFLFCGSSHGYLEVIEFVVSAFERLKDYTVKLVLVTSRNQDIDNRIRLCEKRELIVIFSDIPYADLVNLYMHSEALIMPMRNNDQDKARFPHKLSEYCASRRPIITNSVGEIRNYFNEANAYLCDGYSAQAFADTMQRVLSDPVKAMEVAENGYQTGIEKFNYKTYSQVLVGLF